MVTTESISTLEYQNKLMLLKQSLILYFNLMTLESNSLRNLSEQDDKGWNITPYNAFSGGYISCGWKTQTDSKVPDDLNILLKID